MLVGPAGCLIVILASFVALAASKSLVEAEQDFYSSAARYRRRVQVTVETDIHKDGASDYTPYYKEDMKGRVCIVTGATGNKGHPLTLTCVYFPPMIIWLPH